MADLRTGRGIRGRLASIGSRITDRGRGGEAGAPESEAGPEPERTERLFDDSFEQAPAGDARGKPEPGHGHGGEGRALKEGAGGRREAMRRRLLALRRRRSAGAGDGGRRRAAAGAATSAGAAIRRSARGGASAVARGFSRVSGRWLALPLLVRQRLAAGVALAALAALVWFVLLPAAPCQFPGGDTCPPDDRAIELVPADAAVYFHINLDQDTEQYEAAAAIGERLPLLVGDIVGQLPAATDRAVDFETEVRPWSGGEVAIALLPSGTGIDRVLLASSDDDEAALGFGRSLLGGPTTERELDGVELTVDGDGLATGIVDDFLVLGPEQSVSQVISASAGDADRLDDDSDASETLDHLPEHRLADLYISGDGARTLAADGALGPFETFVNSGATRGVAAGLAFGEDEIELAIRSLLDPERAESQPGVLGALNEFEPELTGDVRSDALAYLGLGNPSASLDLLLEQAEAEIPELTEGVDRFSRRLQRQGGVDLRRDLLPLLGGEAAITVEPATVPAEGQGPLGPLDTESPYLGLIATGVDPDAARPGLAELQGPIAATIDPDRTGQAPVFRSTEIDGVEVQSLRVSPVVDLSYALYDDRLVAGSKREAIERARVGGDPLDEAEVFEQAADGMPEEVALLLYLNLADLFALGEQVGLAEDPGYVLRAQDLRSLSGAVVAVSRPDGELATDLRVTVGERAEPVLDEPLLEEQLPPAEEVPPPEELPGDGGSPDARQPPRR